MKEIVQKTFSLEIPAELGGGAINEAEYQPTHGTNALLDALLKEETEAHSFTEGLVGRLLSPYGEEYIAAVLGDESGSELLRAFHSTDSLVTDRYDIAEAVRLTGPIGKLIEAKRELGHEMSPVEYRFDQRISDLVDLQDAIDTELERPYRIDEAPTTGINLRIEGTYSVEDEVVHAVDVARVPELPGFDVIDISSAETPPSDAAELVQAFYGGRIDSIDFCIISLVHTLQSADAIDAIALGSSAGRISAESAGSRVRKFLWHGNQVELDQEWVSVVAGGDASQN